MTNKSLIIAALLTVVAPAWADTKPIIAMYGDSTTAGTTLFPGTGNGYYTTGHNEPAQLQAALPNATVTNNGIFARTCDDFLNGRNGVAQNWWVTMAASKATIVVINLGMNDALSSAAGEDFYTQCVGDLIRIAQGNGKIVAIETPNPATWNSVGGFPGNVQRYAQLAADAALANNAFVIDQWTYDQDLPDWETHLSDGIHPDDTLYAHKAGVSLTVLGAILKTLAP